MSQFAKKAWETIELVGEVVGIICTGLIYPFCSLAKRLRHRHQLARHS